MLSKKLRVIEIIHDTLRVGGGGPKMCHRDFFKTVFLFLMLLEKNEIRLSGRFGFKGYCLIVRSKLDFENSHI